MVIVGGVSDSFEIKAKIQCGGLEVWRPLVVDVRTCTSDGQYMYIYI